MTSSKLAKWRDRPPGRHPASRRTAASLAALGLLMLLVLTACSGATGSPGVATLVDPSASPDASPTASLDPEAAMQAFTACMREHGVDIQSAAVSAGDGSGGNTGPVTNTSKGAAGDKPRSIDKDAFAAAERACKSLLPQGGVNGPGGEIDPEFQDKMLAFAKCMRDHGIDMPDPQFGSGGNTVTIGGPDDGSGDGPKLDPESKAFQDAQTACGSLLPGKLGVGMTNGASGPVKVMQP